MHFTGFPATKMVRMRALLAEEPTVTEDFVISIRKSVPLVGEMEPQTPPFPAKSRIDCDPFLIRLHTAKTQDRCHPRAAVCGRV